MYVLIVVFLNSYGPRPTIEMQEFSSQKTCESAAASVIRMWAQSRDSSNLNGVTCTLK